MQTDLNTPSSPADRSSSRGATRRTHAGWGLAIGLLFAMSTNNQSLAQAPTGIQAGAAAIDVTPRKFPIRAPGGFRAKYATRAHDPLHARALVFSEGKGEQATTVALVVVDGLGIAPQVMDEARAIASKKTGIPVNRMLISSTHTHTAPPSNVTPDRVEGKAPDHPEANAAAYRNVLVQGIAQSIIKAHAALRPAALAAAKHPLPDEVFNRRWYLKPGKMPANPFGKMDRVKMNPGTSPAVIDRPAGPTDPDVSIISVQDTRRKPIAIYANYALHYVGGVPGGTLSADYFGEFARVMPSRVKANRPGSEGFVAMLSNGASGDINNIPFGVTRPPREPFEQIRIVARKTADAAWHAHRKIEKHRSDVTLAMAEKDITLKLRKPTAEQIAAAEQVIKTVRSKDEAAIAKLPRLADAYARRTLGMAKSHADGENSITVKLQAIRIGDIAVLGIPFEVLVEIGLELKQKSPLKHTIVVGLANGRHGYLPTPRQHELGGYETWMGTCKVQKDASVIITRELLAMLDSIREK